MEFSTIRDSMHPRSQFRPRSADSFLLHMVKSSREALRTYNWIPVSDCPNDAPQEAWHRETVTLYVAGP